MLPWLLLALGALALAGCDTGSLSLRVDAFDDAVDAAPGDRVCATSAGTCTLRAAIDEANATASPVFITLPAGTYDLSRTGSDHANQVGDLDVTGDVLIDAEGAGARIDAAGMDHGIEVHGTLSLFDVGVHGAVGDGIAVPGDGVLNVARSSVTGGGGAGIAVAPGGSVHAWHVTLASNAPGLRNEGTVDASFLTLTRNTGGIAGVGATRLTGSVVAEQRSGADCENPVVTGGRNLDGDGTCGFADPTDLPSGPAQLGPASATAVVDHHPLAGSVLVDALPVAPDGCGSPVERFDQRATARPQGGGCDVGAVETAAVGTQSFVVDSSTDATDVAPGDGRCASVDGACSLRAAIQETNALGGADTVTFDAAITAVELSQGIGSRIRVPGIDDDLSASGDLDVLDDLTISGPGVVIGTAPLTSRLECVSVGGGIGICDWVVGADRVLHLPGDATVTVSGLEVAGAHLGRNVVLVEGGEVRLEELTIRGSVGYDGGVVRIAGGDVEIASSTLTANANAADCPFDMSGRCSGPDLTQDGGTLEIVQSTIGVNGATFDRILFCSRSCFTAPHQTTSTGVAHLGGDLVVRASTVERLAAGAAGTVVLLGSAIEACTGPATSGGHNAIVGAACLGAPDPTDLFPANLGLEPMADNGGPTPTRVPGDTSVLVDGVPAGTAGLCDGSLPVDQRGVARTAGPGCDIGATERVDAPAPEDS